MIPPEENAEFVCQMEQVLDVYHRPYDPQHPVICMDESPSQLIGETRKPYIDGKGGKKQDYEYVRNGVVSIFMAVEPLTGNQVVEARDSHTSKDYVMFLEKLAAQYPNSHKITLVQDNLSTHKPYAFYKFFAPDKARSLVEKFNFVYTPKHGSWLNMAEIALNVLKKQCLNRRMPDKQTMQEQIEAWLKDQQRKKKPIEWQFDIDDARAKLKNLYPKF